MQPLSFPCRRHRDHAQMYAKCVCVFASCLGVLWEIVSCIMHKQLPHEAANCLLHPKHQCRNGLKLYEAPQTAVRCGRNMYTNDDTS